MTKPYEARAENCESSDERRDSPSVAFVMADLIGILDASDIPTVVVGRDCKVTRFNRAAADTLGATQSDVGCHVCDMQALKDVPGIEQMCMQAMLDGVSSRSDVRNGDRWFLARIAPYTGSDSEIRGAVLTFTNITAFRASLGQAVYEREYTKAILNAGNDPLVVLDERLQVQTANRAFYELFGVSREKTQGIPFRNFGDDEWKASGLWSSLEATLADGCEFQTMELEHEFPQSGRRTVLLDACRLLRDGNVLVILSFRDITASKQAEEVRSRLAAVVESSDDAILSKSLDGTITTWNPGATRMFGYTPEEVIGKSVTLLSSPDEIDEELHILNKLRQGERFEHFETLRVRKDGTKIIVSLSVSPIKDVNGEVIGASMIVRDVTHRKAAERSLQELYEAAQREIARREEAETMLREIDRRKDEFLATLAHELRNPLAPIRQASAISKAAAASDEQKRWSQGVIDRQVHNMALLLDDLLDISRVTRGTLELRPQMTDLTSIVATATETARPLIEAKRHALKIEIPDEPARFAADPLRLAQVLSNLLTNAAKYTDPEGEIRLRAMCSAETVTFSVADNGIGIPPGALQEVFAMFSQVKSAQDRSEGGLGIGLALAKGIVHLHRGTIEVRSAGAGLGSEFIVKLPRRTLSAGQPDVASVPSAPPVRRRVLIADDNRDAAESLAILLRMDGHEIMVVHNGRQAVATIESFRPEIALLDIGMPELNGYEVARHIRQGPLGPLTTLIAVTGWGQAADKARAAAAGFNHHLTKPIEPNALVQMLRNDL